MDSALYLTLLGELSVTADGKAVELPVSRKARGIMLSGRNRAPRAPRTFMRIILGFT